MINRMVRMCTKLVSCNLRYSNAARPGPGRVFDGCVIGSLV